MKAQQTGPYLSGQLPDPPASSAYTYDNLGRTTLVTAADTSKTQYIYQANFTSVIDPAGKWKQFANDAFGNLVAVIEPDPSFAPLVTSPPDPPAYPVTVGGLHAGTLLTSYNYDLMNHLATTGTAPEPHPRGEHAAQRWYADQGFSVPGHDLRWSRLEGAVAGPNHEPGGRHHQLQL